MSIGYEPPWQSAATINLLLRADINELAAPKVKFMEMLVF